MKQQAQNDQFFLIIIKRPRQVHFLATTSKQNKQNKKKRSSSSIEFNFTHRYSHQLSIQKSQQVKATMPFCHHHRSQSKHKKPKIIKLYLQKHHKFHP